MAPLRLLAALLAAHIQLNFGQQINEGNNLIAVASHKLAAIKQQSQKQNFTDTNQTAETEDIFALKAEQNLEQVDLNTSTLYPGGGTITGIKFVPYSAYDGAPPTISIINSKNTVAVDPNFGSYETSLIYLKNTTLNDEQLNTDTGHVTNEQTEEKVSSITKSPVFISFTPRRSGAMSPQSPYIISALPAQSPTSSMATLQPSSSPQKQQSLQTFSSLQFQPSNVQSPANMRLRFVPATVPLQSTVPAQGAIPIQSTMPIQNTVPIQNAVPLQNTVPIQNSVPLQNTVPIQNSVPLQNTVPIQNSVPLQNTVPIQNAVLLQNTVPIQNAVPLQNTVAMQNAVPTQNTVPMQNTAPIQRTAIQSSIPIQSTVPLQSTAPIQNTIDNVIQNPQLSLLMSHLLSRSPIKKDCPTSTNIRYVGLDQQQPSKETTVKTILPLLLQLLTEKHNNCCEYRNKKERSRSYSRYKQGKKKVYEKFEPDFCMRSDSAHHFHRGNQYKRLKKPVDETLEEEDYSNESSDYEYTDEVYDDED